MDFDPERLEKLKILRENGFEPYGGKYEIDKQSIDIKKNFKELENSNVKVAGRVIGKRDHGKLKFLDLADITGNIQIYIRSGNLDKKSSELVGYLDIGDIIGVKGKVVKTQTGEISVEAIEITLLSKSLLPLPSKWYGLEDTEKRYRKRYLDFIINTDSREKIIKGSAIIAAIRNTLEKKGFIEVTVPLLNPIPGGANAKPFITHYNALDRDFYLKIASELYLKRLLVGGFEKIFDISKDMRNEGIDTKHNPEFIMLELYQAYGDITDMMSLTEELIKTSAKAVNGTYIAQYAGNSIDLSKFSRKTMEEAVKDELGESNEKKLIEKAKSIEKKTSTYGEALNILFEEYVEKKLIQPTFITDYPIEISPLAKTVKGDDRFTYRFELFIGGMEITNAFSELNDPLEQIKRFEEEARRKERGIDETQEFDRDFIEAMGYGMPPAGGVGIGLERVQMILTDSKSIKDVIAFPQLRTLDEE